MIARVVYLEAIEGHFDYLVPSEMEPLVRVGMRVVVPMRRQLQTALILGLPETSEVPLAKLKPVRDLLDPEPLLAPELLRLADWVAEYYLAPAGLVYRTLFPPGTQVRSRIRVRSGRAIDESIASLHPTQQAILRAIPASGDTTAQWISHKIDETAISYHLQRLEALGWIRTELATEGSDVGPKTRQAVRLPEERSVEQALAMLPRPSPRQTELLRHLAANPGWHVISGMEDEFPNSRATLHAMAERDAIDLSEQEVRRTPFSRAAENYPVPERLTDDQKSALEGIRQTLGGPAVHLVHGVTGSGKTEVYLHSVSEVLQAGGQALVLVPEISLTPQMIDRFRGRFGNRVGVLHSALSAGERFDEHERIRRGEADVVVGARSAVFAPLKRLGLIVVDEEHDPSYKQDTAPCYHGRDVAIVRGAMEGCPVVLGSATPSLESFHHASTGKYVLHEIKGRVGDLGLPPVEVIDLRLAYDRKEMLHGLAESAHRAITDTLEQGNQALIYLNRRGYDTTVSCLDCGEVVYCPHCAVAITFHKKGGDIRCHYCGHSEPPPRQCPACKSTSLSFRGLGTQKLEETLETLFPMARIARMDSDALGRHGAHEKLLRAIGKGEFDIVVGTRMLTKGHDFPLVTLVVIASVDGLIHRPDFRAAEQAFQEITQVAGRAGRRGEPARVLLQTFLPEHPVIQAAKTHDYHTFAGQELLHRRALGYPPFNSLLSIELRHSSESNGENHAMSLAEFLRGRYHSVEVRGPAPCLIARLKDVYRFQILLVHSSRKELRKAGAGTIEYGRLNNLDLRLDVDPVSFL